MTWALMVATVAVESPKRDSFAGGVYANLKYQHLYGFFMVGEWPEVVAVGDRLTGAPANA